MKPKKSWREKLLDSKDLPKTLVIPAPIEVDELMRRIPRGQLATIGSLREALAKKHKTTMACPFTTGIFAWIASHAAEETRAAGGGDVTPWWRTLKSDGILNAKNPGGIAGQKKLLEAEGHRVVRKGKQYVVEDFEKALARIS